ncbi:uncharacterized protein LAESUDRAFT_297530 [Laetiporus sulphureus 93-53]|uniref:Uncharacterized protein n=1 Tax=Laetiporus sulphureus 93-53 TaxID=1314785 RepID=A0A165DBM9_9APHY|nr:uncharacterized protein LAESUDRAFT_297530 [Laetiporus sulphureus 93-53]KZT04493.1 hypothetical protein LAESUDRAFT_297530 [Laetiporus sulphureus 93-53]
MHRRLAAYLFGNLAASSTGYFAWFVGELPFRNLISLRGRLVDSTSSLIVPFASSAKYTNLLHSWYMSLLFLKPRDDEQRHFLHATVEVIVQQSPPVAYQQKAQKATVHRRR